MRQRADNDIAAPPAAPAKPLLALSAARAVAATTTRKGGPWKCKRQQNGYAKVEVVQIWNDMNGDGEAERQEGTGTTITQGRADDGDGENDNTRGPLFPQTRLFKAASIPNEVLSA